MQKWSKYLLIFIVGVVGVAVGLGFSLKPNNVSLESPPAVATLSSSSSIFNEVKTDGLASYLEITLPEASTNIKSIKITQTIDETSLTPTKDEIGTTCYQTNALGVTKPVKFRFTRPAIYTVQYIVGNSSVITERCTFAPEINTAVLENLHTTPDGGTTKNMISKTSSGFVFTQSGTLTLPADSHGLYTVSASTKMVESTALLATIPDESFGTVTYKLTSNNGHTFLTQDVTVLTADFNIEFSDENNNPLEKSSFSYLDGYVFNQGITASITIKDGMVDLNGNPLILGEKLKIFSLLDLTLEKTVRNSSNTLSLTSSYEDLIEPTENPVLTIRLPKVDHTIYSIVTSLKNADSSNSKFSNNLPKFKIITKVPTNDSGKYIFSAVLGQGENHNTNNYIDGVLNGYLTTGTTIYYPAHAVRLFYNGYSNITTPLNYSLDSTSGTIKVSESKDFIATNGSTISLSNQTLLFDEFFTFTFDIKTYNNSNEFIESMLRNRMFYNGSNVITDAFGDDTENTITTPLNSFKYVAPSNYETDCIPTYIRVTYNGTSFNNIYELKNNDTLEFFAYGNYVVEFYNVSNYEFLVKNHINDNSSTHYYYKLTFTIAGPSINATTTDYNGKQLTISNNLYTQNTASLSVKIQEGQQFVVYHNGNESARIAESKDFTLSNIGTWKIAILNAEGREIRTLSFTIADKLYQGFSINNRDEYASLVVSTKVSSMPVVFEQMEHSNAYHLTQAGTYKVDIDAKEELSFILNGAPTSAYTINSNSIVFDVTKSYFALYYSQGSNGSRVSKAVTVASVYGVQLQSLEVYRNNKLVTTFTAEQLAAWDTLSESARSFSDNGTYTFKLTDKFGNTYESQIEKYYKVNVALVFLILIAIAGVILMIVTIIKSRHKVKVK